MTADDKFDPAKFDPSKVPSDWTPHADDLPANPKTRGDDDVTRPLRNGGSKGVWWVAIIIALLIIERVSRTDGLHIP
jgi:hypothetical protein